MTARAACGLSTSIRQQPFPLANSNAITVTPSQAGDPLTLVLETTSGTLTLDGTAGLSSVSGNGTNDVTLSGTADQINAALDGLVYTSPADTGAGGTPAFDLLLTDNTTGVTAGTSIQLAGFFASPSTGTLFLTGLPTVDSLSIAYADPQDITVTFDSDTHLHFAASSINQVTFDGNGGQDSVVVFGALGAARPRSLPVSGRLFRAAARQSPSTC